MAVAILAQGCSAYRGDGSVLILGAWDYFQARDVCLVGAGVFWEVRSGRSQGWGSLSLGEGSQCRVLTKGLDVLLS